MRFPYPVLPATFELPDDWLAEAGLSGFRPATSAFRSTAKATHVMPLRVIEPPFRWPEHPKDFQGFDRARMVHLLARIAADAVIDPPTAIALPVLEFRPAPFRYRIWDGLHRYYASIAAGFECIPLQDVDHPTASAEKP